MDTAIPSISVLQLGQRLGTPRWPVVLDVRREPHYAEDSTTLPAAQRRLSENLAQWVEALPRDSEIVCHCVYGHHVYAWCRHAHGEKQDSKPEAVR